MLFIQLLYGITIFVLFLYISLIVFYRYYWEKTPQDKLIKGESNTFISVIIAGRNESKNLLKCIKSIIDNDYSKSLFEIIYIDDFSSDNSVELLKNIEQENFCFLELKDFIGKKEINNYKKKAIEIAISRAKGDIILQTDADTVVGKKWLLSHANKYRDSRTKFVAGPVLMISNDSPLEQFQKYDFITTMGVTCAGIKSKLHFMANGANMSFCKDAFTSTNADFASGDDMFLVQDIAEKYPDSIEFLKSRDAVVYTFPEKTLEDFIKQRLRWATKTKGYSSPTLKYVFILVFLTNFFILINLFLAFIKGWSQLYIALIFILVKIFIDLVFIKSISHFFDEKIKYRFLIPSLLSYPYYIVFIGLLSLVKTKYQWKSRTVK